RFVRDPRLSSADRPRLPRAVSRPRDVPDAQLLGREGDDGAHQPAREFSEEHRAARGSVDDGHDSSPLAAESRLVDRALEVRGLTLMPRVAISLGAKSGSFENFLPLPEIDDHCDVQQQDEYAQQPRLIYNLVHFDRNQGTGRADCEPPRPAPPQIQA